MARKTPLMLRVEEQYKRPLEKLLPEMVNEMGLSATADELFNIELVLTQG